MRSFINRDNIFNIFCVSLLTAPLIVGAISACAMPGAKEMNEIRAEGIKDDMTTVSPRPGVECYILRAHSSAEPRTMSCVGTIPTTTGQ